jgi:hypothetical protein
MRLKFWLRSSVFRLGMSFVSAARGQSPAAPPPSAAHNRPRLRAGRTQGGLEVSGRE